MERTCKNCGNDEFEEIEELESQYPDRRSRDKNKTTRRIFVCTECGKEGRLFEDGFTNTETYSGALRA